MNQLQPVWNNKLMNTMKTGTTNITLKGKNNSDGKENRKKWTNVLEEFLSLRERWKIIHWMKKSRRNGQNEWKKEWKKRRSGFDCLDVRVKKETTRCKCRKKQGRKWNLIILTIQGNRRGEPSRKKFRKWNHLFG